MKWLLSLTLTLLVGSQQSNPWLLESFQKARQAEKQGQLEEAASIYRAILRRDSHLPEVHHNLGLIYYQLKQYQQAADSLGKALQLKPDLLGSQLFLGLTEFRLGEFEKSAGWLRKVLAIEPHNREAQLFLIRDERALDRCDVATFQNALGAFPNDVELNFTVGLACIERIREISRQAKDLGPASPVYLWLSLRKAEEKKDSEATEKHRQELNKLGSVEIPPIVQEYDRLASLVDHCFHVVLTLAPDSRYAGSVRGYFCESQNQIEEALKEYRAAGDHFFAARLLAQNVRLPEAETEYQMALQADPQNHRAMADLAMLYVQKGEYEKALPLLNRLLQQYPTDAEGWADLGKVQHKMGQIQEAVRSFGKALELDPSLNNVHYQLASVYRTLGRSDLASEELAKFEATRKDELKKFEARRTDTTK
jgi:tetratricopeptide (TPR) repeat protein